MDWQTQQQLIYKQQQTEKEQAKRQAAEQQQLMLKMQFAEQQQRTIEQAAERERQIEEQHRKEQEQQAIAMQRIADGLKLLDEQRKAQQREARERAKQHKINRSKESPIEQTFREAWHQKYPEIELEFQYSIGRYRVDIAHVPTMTYCELDGAHYHSGTKRIAYDSNRQRDLILLGWLPVRFGGLEINLNAENCVDQFHTIITARKEKP